MYGPDRVLYPAVRKGPKGSGWFERVSWDDALARIAERLRGGARRVRRRGDPSLLVRRIERPADAGHERRGALPPARRLAPRAHRVRRATGAANHGALRQDAVGRLRGLPRGAADHPVGRQPVGLGHPSRALPARSAEARREARGRRSAHDAARQTGGPAPAGPAGHGPARGACRSTAILFEEGHADAGVPRRAHAQRRSAARARADVDVRVRGGRSRRRRPPSSNGWRELYADDVAGADSLRLGPGAQSQRRLSSMAILALPAVGRQVRRPRRRLRDEQQQRVGHRAHRGFATRSRRRGS